MILFWFLLYQSNEIKGDENKSTRPQMNKIELKFILNKIIFLVTLKPYRWRDILMCVWAYMVLAYDL